MEVSWKRLSWYGGLYCSTSWWAKGLLLLLYKYCTSSSSWLVVAIQHKKKKCSNTTLQKIKHEARARETYTEKKKVMKKNKERRKEPHRTVHIVVESRRLCRGHTNFNLEAISSLNLNNQTKNTYTGAHRVTKDSSSLTDIFVKGQRNQTRKCDFNSASKTKLCWVKTWSTGNIKKRFELESIQQRVAIESASAEL